VTQGTVKIAYTVAALAGAAGWAGVSLFTGRREAWDSELYFTVLLPATAAVAAVLGFAVPQRTWRWAMTPYAAQAVVAFVQNPMAGLLPIGLVVFAVFGALCLLPAWAGGALRRRFGPATS
jgi:hypothetical protein